MRGVPGHGAACPDEGAWRVEGRRRSHDQRGDGRIRRRIYDPSALVAAINDTGYLSHLPTKDDAGISAEDARDAAHAREFEQLRNKSMTSLVLGVLAMIASMPLMAAGHHAGPIHCSAWQMRVLDPLLRAALPALYSIDPTRLLDALLAATVFVMAWAGRHFYVGAWKSLRHGSANMNTLTSRSAPARPSSSIGDDLRARRLIVRRRRS